MQVVGAVRVGKGDQLVRRRSHTGRYRDTLPPIFGQAYHPHPFAGPGHRGGRIRATVIHDQNLHLAVEEIRGPPKHLKSARQPLRLLKRGYEQ